MAEHTPGPWEVRDRFYVHGKHLVAEVDVRHGKAEANASFIAAAPDMEKALELMLGLHDCDCDFCRMAHEALAKARGRSL